MGGAREDGSAFADRIGGGGASGGRGQDGRGRGPGAAPRVRIRTEAVGGAAARADAEAIERVIARAFAGHPHSDQSEGRIVRALRASSALTISLVAVDERRFHGDRDDADRDGGGRPVDRQTDGASIVGHVAFSPVVPADGARGWYGLAPLSVDPARQRAGIGAALIGAGLAQLRALGAAGCVVLGDPAYYCRFGFRAQPDLVYAGAPPDHFQALSFGGPYPRGEVAYHSAFGSG